MSDTDARPSRPRDDPERALTPRFRAPATPPENPEEPATTLATGDSPPVGRATLATTTANRPFLPLLRRGAGSESPDSADRPAIGPTGRTGTSTAGDDGDLGEPSKVSKANVIALVAGIIAVAATAANVAVRWQLKRQLRQPSKRQRREIAAPAARILMRHADMAKLAPDLVDALDLAAATGAYVGDGPLLQPLNHTADSGLPDDLNQEDL